MAQNDIRVIRLPNNQNRDGSQNIGSLVFRLPDVAARLRRFY
jgi:hypothetical protein